MNLGRAQERIYTEYYKVAFSEEEKTADRMKALSVLREMTKELAVDNSVALLCDTARLIAISSQRN